jgi:VWFA-related protein
MKINLSYLRFVSLSLILALGFSTLNVLAQSGRQKPTSTDQKKNQRDDKKSGDQSEPKEELPKDIINKPQDGDVVTVATNIVNVDTVVYHKKTGQIVTGLKKKNFAIFEEKDQQVEISNFSTPEAPITVAVVVEFSKLGQALGYYGSGGMDDGKLEVIRPVAAFLSQFIKPPDDYASVVAFDMRPTPLTDFTNDPQRLQQVIYLLLRNSPAFTETNVRDALKFTLLGGKGDPVVLENTKEKSVQYGGLKDIQGRRKAILLVASGLDTFSKINLDEAYKIVRSSGVPIYVIGTGELFLKKYGDRLSATSGIAGSIDPGRMDFYQAKNFLNTIARESGGQHFPVTFEGEIPTTLQSINALLRNQYSLAFVPGEAKKDGKSHKIVVKVDVDGDGKYDDKDYVVQHRQVYVIPKPGDKK